MPEALSRLHSLACKHIALFACLLALLPGNLNAAINFDRLLNLATQQYGARGQQNITDLRTLFNQLESASEKEKLIRINEDPYFRQ